MLRTGIITTLLLVFLCHIINAQLITQDYLVDSSNNYIQSRAENVEESGWVDFENDKAPETTVLFDSLRQHAGLGSKDEMKLDREWTDDTLDYTHKRYDQYYKNIKVENAELTEHLEDCFVQILHGDIVENFDRSVSPSVSDSSALQDALEYLGYDYYAWESTAWEDSLKEQSGDETATYYPEGELVLAKIGTGDLVPSNYELSWSYRIKALDTTTADTAIHDHRIYISADTGGVVKELSPLKHGTGQTTQYGNSQEIDTKSKLWWYILKTDDHGRDIITKEGGLSYGDSHWFQGHVTDSDDDWGASTEKPVTAHYVVQESWDLYDEVFGRKGFDDDGRRVRVWSNPFTGDSRYVEKHYLGFLKSSYIEFRHWDSEQDNTFTATLDFAGHEFTHGVIDYTSNINLRGEPGAIAESFCDIFGFLVERSHYQNNPGSFDWIIGEDSNPQNQNDNLRSLIDPSDYNDPEVYGGVNWVTANCGNPAPSNDYCGIHTNTGVQNHWFYHLAQGFGENNGIGIDDAAKIAYRSMTVYMDNNSNYEDAREGSIRAAIDLFGKCSYEHQHTINTWNEVGVGESWNQLNIECVDIHGTPVICGNKFDVIEPITYTATGEPGVTFNWSNIPSEWSTNISGSNNQFLEITDFGSQSYPSTESFSVSSSGGGSETFDLEIINCDFKPCENIPDGGKVSKDRFSMNVYPNPSSGKINISTSEEVHEGELIIINLSGMVVHKESMTNSVLKKISLDVESGIYFIRLMDSGNTYTKKLIISTK